MNDVARRAAEEVTRMAIANVSPGAKPTTAEERTAVIQSAIKEAIGVYGVYLKCAKCKKITLRYSSTIDELRCQTCGVAYLNCEQVGKMITAKSGDTKRLDWLEGERPIMTSGGLEIEATESLRDAIDAAMKQSDNRRAEKGK